MRFNSNDISKLQALPPRSEGWQEAPALGEKRIQNYGLVASGLGIFLVSILLRRAFIPHGLLATLLILTLTMPLHEFIHAVSTPNWGLSSNTIVGIQKSRGLFMPYVYYDGEQPLWHFLLTGVTPTIFLTVLPIIVVMLVPLRPVYSAGLGFLSFFNMGISGGDLVIVIWLVIHLDLRSSVRQNGWKLYWKPAI